MSDGVSLLIVSILKATSLSVKTCVTARQGRKGKGAVFHSLPIYLSNGVSLLVSMWKAMSPRWGTADAQN